MRSSDTKGHILMNSRKEYPLALDFDCQLQAIKNFKIKELQLKQKAIEKEEKRDQLEWQAALQNLKAEIKLNINAYTFYQNTIDAERTQLKNLGDQIIKKEGFDPLLLLDIEERNINAQLKAFKLKEDILYDYLKYLELVDQQCNLPLVANWSEAE